MGRGSKGEELSVSEAMAATLVALANLSTEVVDTSGGSEVEARGQGLERHLSTLASKSPSRLLLRRYRGLGLRPSIRGWGQRFARLCQVQELSRKVGMGLQRLQRSIERSAVAAGQQLADVQISRPPLVSRDSPLRVPLPEHPGSPFSPCPLCPSASARSCPSPPGVCTGRSRAAPVSRAEADPESRS